MTIIMEQHALDALIAKAIAEEREACAEVCDSEAGRSMWNWSNDLSINKQFWNGGESIANSCAASIRARSCSSVA